MESAVQEYLAIARLFGACVHRVQGAGGNLSIKYDTKILLKTSGTCLAEASKQSGYVVCPIDSLKRKLETNNEDVLSCVQYGDVGKPPSLECFLHLLPYRVILHFHPTAFLSSLCRKDAREQFKKLFPSTLFVPYKKPGISLAKSIFETYKGEDILFLENHGVILCTNELDAKADLSAKYKSLVRDLPLSYSDVECEAIYKKNFPSEYILKPCYSISRENLPCFFPALTPDQYLFLKEAPYNLEQDPRPTLQTAFNHSVYRDKSFVYVLGKTMQQCRAIEEILLSFLEFYDSDVQSEKVLTHEEKEELTSCSKEVYRLSLKE